MVVVAHVVYVCVVVVVQLLSSLRWPWSVQKGATFIVYTSTKLSNNVSVWVCECMLEIVALCLALLRDILAITTAFAIFFKRPPDSIFLCYSQQHFSHYRALFKDHLHKEILFGNSQICYVAENKQEPMRTYRRIQDQ